MNDRDIVRGIEARATKRLQGKIVTVAADPSNADFLSLEFRSRFDLGFGDDTVRQSIFETADEDEIRGSLHIRTHGADASGQSDFDIAADQRCIGHPG